jgi:flagellar hook assembly protein FlgD
MMDTLFVQVQGDIYEEPIVFNSDIISSQIETKISGMSVFPNPFKDKLAFEFEVDQPGEVKLQIYDASGKLVYKIERNYLSGIQRMEWNGNTPEGKQAPTGSYFYQLFVGGKQKSGKVILSR